MDDHANTINGPIHPDNEQLEIFMNPLPNTTQQPWGFINSISTSSCMNYYFPNRYRCRNDHQKIGKSYNERATKYDGKMYGNHTTNGVHACLHATNNMKYTTRKAPIFGPTSIKCVWVSKPSQVCQVIA